MTDQESCRVDNYAKGLNHRDWFKVKVRNTAKGALKMKVHIVDVWVWDGKEEKPRKRTLVITMTKDKRPKIKYSFSNGGAETYHPKEYAYFQVQRYWVERTFDDSKNLIFGLDFDTGNIAHCCFKPREGRSCLESTSRFLKRQALRDNSGDTGDGGANCQHL